MNNNNQNNIETTNENGALVNNQNNIIPSYETKEEDSNKNAKRTDVYFPRYTQIVAEEGFNARENGNYGDLQALGEDIAVNGLLVSLKGHRRVVDGVEKFYVTDGFRRLAASILVNNQAIEAGHEIPIPVLKFECISANPEERLFTMLRTGDDVFKLKLHRLEEAKILAKLKEFGYTVEEIAKKLAKSVAYIYDSLRLYDAPKKMHNAIWANQISITAAVSMVKRLKGDYNAIVAELDAALAEVSDAADVDSDNSIDSSSKSLDSEKSLDTPQSNDSDNTPTPPTTNEVSAKVETKKEKVAPKKQGKISVATAKAGKEQKTYRSVFESVVEKLQKEGKQTFLLEQICNFLQINPSALDPKEVYDTFKRIVAPYDKA